VACNTRALKISVVTANGVEYSKVAVKDNTSWQPNVNSCHKGREWTAVDLKITEKLRRMKHHLVSAEEVRQGSPNAIEPQDENHDRSSFPGEVESVLRRTKDPKIAAHRHQG